AWKNGGGALFRLSLERANLAVLERAGVRDENIVILEECTCCNPLFGSNRRETLEGGGFTVQAAFVVR
ncbi:MAG: laccase domain-containing protein, partial [Treponemataceae bacterium]|nr:laccase domain-containing protein [Treponemataceae bacterium]